MATFRITGGALTGVLMSDAYPDNTLPVPQPPLGIWGGGNVPMPSPPMVPGGGGYWGQANDPGYGVPRPPLGIWGGPWQPPYPSQGPGFPTHPIAPGGPPLGTWGGAGQPYPVPPIYFPPEEGSGPPLGTWGPNDPRPTVPIALPPDMPPTMPSPDNRPIEWKTGWTAHTGWVVVGVPSGPAPTPSAAG